MPILAFIAFMAGAMLPLQAIANAELGRFLGSSLWSATVSGALLTAILAAIAIGLAGAPRTAAVQSLPIWAWTGGVFGAFVLTATTVLTPRVGAAVTFSMIIAGEVASMLLVDHFGLFGLAVHPLTIKRVLAGVLLVTGATLTL